MNIDWCRVAAKHRSAAAKQYSHKALQPLVARTLGAQCIYRLACAHNMMRLAYRQLYAPKTLP